MARIETKIIFCGAKCVLSCDGNCSKAWGINWSLEKYEPAPTDPGTYEDGHAKPTDKKHNKWCARECERSDLRDR